MPVVLDFLRSVDSTEGFESDFAMLVGGDDIQNLPGSEFAFDRIGKTGDGVLLMPGQTERGGGIGYAKLQRQDAHPHEITAVDSFKTLRKNTTHSLEHGTLSGPVPA